MARAEKKPSRARTTAAASARFTLSAAASGPPPSGRSNALGGETRTGFDPRSPGIGTETETATRGGQMAEMSLQGKRIAFLATDMVEQVELTEPWNAVKKAGAQPELLSIEDGEIQGFNHYDKADKFKVDKQLSAARMDDYDGLVLPGGVGNPDTLRMDDDAVEFVRSFFEAGKPVAAICHAPWLLLEADVVRGRKLTSFWSVKTDVRNAGGNWVDEKVVVDSGLVTSRSPDDLPAFNEKLVEEFYEGRHAEQAQKTGATA
jgi:deglycase